MGVSLGKMGVGGIDLRGPLIRPAATFSTSEKDGDASNKKLAPRAMAGRELSVPFYKPASNAVRASCSNNRGQARTAGA